MDCRQVAAEVGDGGVFVGQLPRDRDRVSVLRLRLDRTALCLQQAAEPVVAVRQAAAEIGDGRVLLGELTKDRQSRAELRLRLDRTARPPQQAAEAIVADSPGTAGTG